MKKTSEMFPLLLSHCQANMEKRIKLLHEALIQLREFLKKRAFYQLVAWCRMVKFPIEEEFPHTEDLRKRVFGDKRPPWLKMWKFLINDCIEKCIQCTLDCGDVDGSRDRYHALSQSAYILVQTRFVQVSEQTSNFFNLASCTRAFRIQHTLHHSSPQISYHYYKTHPSTDSLIRHCSSPSYLRRF